MSELRDTMMRWNGEGRLATAALPAALDAAGVYPGAAGWARFLRVVALVAGGAMLATALVFFIAYNWSEMTRAQRLMLAEGAIVVAVLVAVWRGPDALGGAIALGVACVAIGALLALVGQTYQTGADTWQLFAAWAAAILPLVLLGRQGALWLLWLAIANVGLELWFARLPWFEPSSMRGALWSLAALNAGALALFEVGRALGLRECSATWVLRCVAVASACAATALGVVAVFDTTTYGVMMGMGWLAWLGVLWLAFRVRRVDVFVLATGLVSAIVVLASFFTKYVFAHTVFFSPLLIAALVVGMAWKGTALLRGIAAEEQP